MKIQITSDNHVEFLRNNQKFARKLPVNADILIVAGDLGTISCVRGALTTLCERFKHVIFVAGNHEYYGSSFPQVRAILREFGEKHDNFHYLDRNVVEIDGQRFVGCTMWFPMTPQAEILSNQLNDFYHISNFRQEVGLENDKDCKFLRREVRKGDVVITHHAPSEQSAPDRYKGDPLNCFYITNMERFICGVEPTLWIHGHMHNSSDYMIHETRVICNPGGYTHEPNTEYEPKVIELMNKEKTLNSLQLTTGDFKSKIPLTLGYDRFFKSYLKKAEIPERYQGIAPYRYADNPKEKLWAMFFLNKNTDPSTGSPKDQFAHLLVGNTVDVGFLPEDEITEGDMRLLATAFQWLGSPVGHQAMIELLCSLPENDKNYIIQRLQQTL